LKASANRLYFLGYWLSAIDHSEGASSDFGLTFGLRT
jgi:hypothetical protein